MVDSNETWQGSYLRRVCKAPLLTRAQEKLLAEQIASGSIEARERMISANLRLVVKIAGSYARPGIDPLDLVSEGTRGLMSAVSKYRHDGGARFSTYASFWIHQSIRRHIDAFLMPWRLSSSARDRLNKLMRISYKYSEILGRKPTSVELAAEVGLTPEEVSAILDLGVRPLSLDVEVLDGAKMSDVIPSQDLERMKKQSAALDAQTVVNRILVGLSAREKSIIADRFGLGGRDTLTLDEIGKKHNLTRERIRQIEANALKRLRKASVRINNGAKS